MKTLSVHDRPREKLLRLGAAGLGDNELVAIVVGSGSRRVNALALANDILETTGGLHGMPRTSVDELRRLDGMGCGEGRAGARRRRAGAANAASLSAGTASVRESARRRGVPAAAVRRPARRAVRTDDARHETPAHPHVGRLGRHARLEPGAPARDFSRGGLGVRRGDRAVPQPSVGRSDCRAATMWS